MESFENTGIGYLQLTFYGKEDLHDEFAGRRGAFQDLVTAMAKANEFEIDWFAGVVLHSGNVGEILKQSDTSRSIPFLSRREWDGFGFFGKAVVVMPGE